MPNNPPFTQQQLFEFVDRAAAATYAGGGEKIQNPQRPGFIEYEFADGDFYYRDSYTGFFRSRGMEVVRYKGTPVWTSSYGGGMVDGMDDMAEETFGFLKKAMSQPTTGFQSVRGPANYVDGDWEYRFSQEGDIFEYSGFEEIFKNGQKVFFHRIIGGFVRDR